MSKENMSKKNILDYDEEKTIRPQNFTLTAMKEFYDTIESDQFQGASEDMIASCNAARSGQLSIY